jgi:hypothetical protein
VSEIEKGKKLPGSEILTMLKQHFETDINWILTGDGEPFIGQNPPQTQPTAAKMDENPVVADLLDGARKVLTSGNPVAYDALERNIRYFSHAIEVERRLNAMELRLKKIEERAGPDCCIDHDTQRKAG